MIRAFMRAMRSIYFALFFFATVFSLCTWFFAPYIGNDEWRPFDSITSRVVAICVIWFVFLSMMLMIFLIRRRRDKAMEDDIADAPEQVADDLLGEEVSELRGKFKTAMSELKKSKNGRRHLYDLPWYVMIGPPGAGKTTAIVNSGLQFPLADAMGKQAIGGVGGTRNCDWWFTNNAVLIDTAGRYTTQESDAEHDNASWLGFLGLLKKYRKRQPINGAMIAISLSDLLMQDDMTQKAHAQAVRRRLSELREQLGVRFPVYVLFTKADLIAGFTEFYDGLGKEDREQVWGFTFPLNQKKGAPEPIASFDDQYAALLGRLNAQMLERMQKEIDHQRRALIAGFPPQVASLRSLARDFLNEVFEENRFEKRQMLRGVYFTSGTQEGTPIDRLMLSMAQTFGIGRQAIGSGQGAGRSFFLTRLFEEVIFGEAGLVSSDDKVERRYKWTRAAAIAATVLIAIWTGALWVRSYLGNSDLIAEAEQRVSAYQVAAATLPPNPVGDTDLPPVVDALNNLRDLPSNPVLADPDPERRIRYGLYQGEVLGTQAAQTYRSALNQRFLPRILLRLEEQIGVSMNNPELLYETLKIYLMLGQQGPLNKELVRNWLDADWEVAYGGIARAGLRDDLGTHLEALLSQQMDEIALNGPLVEQAQSVLTELPLAERVYNGIINSTVATQIPKWRITEVGGPSVARAMVRTSGKPLNEGIEGIYTYAGFNDVFLPEAVSVAERVKDEAWVLGDAGEDLQSDTALLALSRDVLDLYYSDFVSRYDQLLGDLDILPMQSLSHAAEVTNILSGPTSPILNILTAVSEETKLTEDRSVNTDNLQGTAVGLARLEGRSTLSPQSQLLLEALASTAVNAANAAQPQLPPGAFVERRFSWLHDLVNRPEGQPSQLDLLLEGLFQVNQALNKMSIAGISDGDAAGQAILLFQQAAAQTQGPLPRWASQITTGSSGVATEGTRASINANWQANVLPTCSQALDNRYPFNKRARADVGLQDFTKLFAPGGLIDTFFRDQLEKHVDTTSRPWTFKRVNNVDLGISPAVLQQFQHAAEIRDAFFASGPQMSVQFQVTAFALDPKAKSVVLDIHGQQLAYEQNGPQNPVAFNWPGSIGLSQITFAPDRRDTESVAKRDGPWAWFRLLDSAEVRSTAASDRKRVFFKVGGRAAIFDMQTGSFLNPFALAALSKFSCPKSM